jgi:hypothetical protein
MLGTELRSRSHNGSRLELWFDDWRLFLWRRCREEPGQGSVLLDTCREGLLVLFVL